MTEIVISMGAEHDRRSPTVSIRVSLPSPEAPETQSSPLLAVGLGQGRLLPDNDALPYRSDALIVNVKSSFDR
jgi:hypothetical protein